MESTSKTTVVGLPGPATTERGIELNSKQRQTRSSKKKLEKLVADGAKNYPAYLKLIYTGDSEFSSEDEFCTEALSSVKREFSQSRPMELSEPLRSSIVSPESDKLLDPGREKMATPVDSGGHCFSRATGKIDQERTGNIYA